MAQEIEARREAGAHGWNHEELCRELYRELDFFDEIGMTTHEYDVVWRDVWLGSL